MHMDGLHLTDPNTDKARDAGNEWRQEQKIELYGEFLWMLNNPL